MSGDGSHLSWTGVDGASVYRVNVRDEESGNRRTIYVGPNARCALAPELAAARGPWSWRVEVRGADESDAAFRTLHPYRLQADATRSGDGPFPDDVIAVLSHLGAAPLYRFFVRDDTDAAVLDLIAERPVFRIPAGRLDALRRHRWRLFVAVGDGWTEATEYRDLPLRALEAAEARRNGGTAPAGGSRGAPAPAPAAGDGPVRRYSAQYLAFLENHLGGARE